MSKEQQNASTTPLMTIDDNTIIRLENGQIGIKMSRGGQHFVLCDGGERTQPPSDEGIEAVAFPSEIPQKYLSALTLLQEGYDLLREDPAPRTTEWIHAKWTLLARAEQELHIPKPQQARSTAWLEEEKQKGREA